MSTSLPIGFRFICLCQFFWFRPCLPATVVIRTHYSGNYCSMVNKTKYLDHLEAYQLFFYCRGVRLKKIATSGNKLLLSSRRIN